MFQQRGQLGTPAAERISLLHSQSERKRRLTKAVTAKLSTSRKGNELQVVVTVANREAGHYVPTGSPLRQLKLEVRADAGAGYHFREERVYRRVVADADETVVTKEHVAFLRGTKVLSDTRLAPEEKRTETFSFPIPPEIQARVTANLRYYYSPMARIDSQKQVNFLSITRLVR